MIKRHTKNFPALAGVAALQLIPRVQAVELVARGRTNEMLISAIEARTQMVAAGLNFAGEYANYVTAYSELHQRAAALTPDELTKLREAHAALHAARLAYAEIEDVIAHKLGMAQRT